MARRTRTTKGRFSHRAAEQRVAADERPAVAARLRGRRRLFVPPAAESGR